MSFDVSAAKSIVIPEGGVLSIKSGEDILWQWGGDEYEKLPYIESSGSQYIDTGLINRSGYRMSGKLRIAGYGAGANMFFAGTYPPIISYMRIRKTDGKVSVGWGAWSDYLTQIAQDTDYTFDTLLSNQLRTLAINGEEAYRDSTPATIEETTVPIRLFDYSPSGVHNTGYSFIGRCYYCRIFEGDEPVRDFIPCKRLSDGEIGMYDLVEGEFYTNQGTGSFTTEE